MNTRLTMWLKSVHYVRELTYAGPEELDPEEQRNFRWERIYYFESERKNKKIQKIYGRWKNRSRH